MENIKLWFLTWFKGITYIIDGIVILVSFGIINTEFTEAILQEMQNIYFKMIYK